MSGKVDGVTLGVLQSYVQAAADAMAHVVERTAYTTFVKETGDFATGLCTPDGEFFAYPREIGVSTFIGLDLATAIRHVKKYHEGDIVITNDPYTTGGMATHLPDVHMYKPIFHDGRLVAFAWAFIHCSDVGGIVPSSVAATCRELFQEGLRILPQKLYRRGVPNEELKELILGNCRTPDANWGDFKAMVAGLNTGERRVAEMIAKFGAETFLAGTEELLANAEARAREVIATMPKGTYSFVDYLEDDARTAIPVRIAVAMTVRDDEVHLDFAGSDPQVAAAYNIPTGGRRHPFLATALIVYFKTRDPLIPLNAGLMRPISMRLPAGSVVNPDFPAAVGTRYATVIRVHDAILGCLSQAVPDQVPAAGAGQSSPVAVSLLDLPTGRRHVAVVEPMMGGGGARPDRDGTTGCDPCVGFLRNTPIESLEAEVPILIRRYELLPGTAGPGRHRGGFANCLEFEILQPGAAVIARSQERFKFQPWGVLGGRPGAPARTRVNPGRPDERDVGKADILHVRPGDLVSYHTPGGGGYGDPLERDPSLVLADVSSGLIDEDAARDEYGVVIVGGRLDEAATRRLRHSRSAAAGPAHFDLGTSRRRYESVWGAGARAAYDRRLESLPPAARPYVREAVHERLVAPRLGDGPPRPPIGPADLDAVWNDLTGLDGRRR